MSAPKVAGMYLPDSTFSCRTMLLRMRTTRGTGGTAYNAADCSLTDTRIRVSKMSAPKVAGMYLPDSTFSCRTMLLRMRTTRGTGGTAYNAADYSGTAVQTSASVLRHPGAVSICKP